MTRHNRWVLQTLFILTLGQGQTVLRGQDKWVLACHAYTFNAYSAVEAVEMTKQAGCSSIELIQGQVLYRTNHVSLDINAPEQAIEQFMAHCRAKQVRPISLFVFKSYGKEKARWRPLFNLGRRLGVLSLVGEPPSESLDAIEELTREFDLRFAIHNHKRDQFVPEYEYWDPLFTLSAIRQRDPRIGICLDTGHLIRSGLDPLTVLREIQPRLLALHLKDPANHSSIASDSIFGTGVGNVDQVLRILSTNGFRGHISIEYERQWTNSLPAIRKCVEFVNRHSGG